jgi:hypothetical protein
MRLWLMILGGLVATSLMFSALHPAHKTLGAQILESLDRRQKVRGAIELVDYEPNLNIVGASADESWKMGEGSLPGRGIPGTLDGRWIDAPGIQFTWRANHWKPRDDPQGESIDPLRNSLARGTEGEHRVRSALSGSDVETVERRLDEAIAAFAGMNDESLMQAWLRADRAVLEESDEWSPAVREALLLESRPMLGPVVVLDAEGHAYLVPLEGSEPGTGWLEIDAYDRSGRLAWSGVLRVDGPGEGVRADPAKVRQIAVRVILEAWSSITGASTRPGSAESIRQEP